MTNANALSVYANATEVVVDVPGKASIYLPYAIEVRDGMNFAKFGPELEALKNNDEITGDVEGLVDHIYTTAEAFSG